MEKDDKRIWFDWAVETDHVDTITDTFFSEYLDSLYVCLYLNTQNILISSTVFSKPFISALHRIFRYFDKNRKNKLDGNAVTKIMLLMSSGELLKHESHENLNIHNEMNFDEFLVFIKKHISGNWLKQIWLLLFSFGYDTNLEISDRYGCISHVVQKIKRSPYIIYELSKRTLEWLIELYKHNKNNTADLILTCPSLFPFDLALFTDITLKTWISF
eukprot:UN33211